MFYEIFTYSNFDMIPIFRDIREQANAMWCFQVKDSSIMTPRYFIHCFRSNTWEEPSLLLMLRLISMSLFLADLIIIKFVLAILIDNLLISHHFFIFASSEFIKRWVILNPLQKRRHWYHLQRFWKIIFLSNLASRLCTIETKEVPMRSLAECHITLSALRI